MGLLARATPLSPPAANEEIQLLIAPDFQGAKLDAVYLVHRESGGYLGRYPGKQYCSQIEPMSVAVGEIHAWAKSAYGPTYMCTIIVRR